MSTLTPELEETVRCALAASWSEATQPGFNPDWPSYNQCAQTAVVIRERFGGEILRTTLITIDGREVDHFYSRIDGRRYDFTDSQFKIPNQWKSVEYHDELSSASAAAENLQSGQVQALKDEFRRQMELKMPSNKLLERTRER